MPELSLRHIDQISRDVSRQEITFSHLLEELIDHVCCDVEYEMQNGADFTEAYLMVKQKMGSNRLKEIQKETLFEVDSKYRKMKNTMKFSGIAGTIMFGFAALFKIQHWPLAGVLMTLGALVLAFIFLPSALGVLWKETHSRKRLFLFISAFVTGMLFISGTLFKIQHWPAAGYILLLAVVTAVFLFVPSLLLNRLNDEENSHKRPVYIVGAAGTIVYILGMFFKIQHWPASATLMVLGLIVLGLIALPWYTWLSWKDESNVTPAFIFIIIGSLLIIVPGALVNVHLQSIYDSGYYSNMVQQQKMFEARLPLNKSILDKYHDSLSFQQMQLLDSRTTEVISMIEDIQKQMIEESEGVPGNPAQNTAALVKRGAGYAISYNMLSKPFHPQPARDFLIPGSPSRQKLDAVLAEYNNYLSALVPQPDSEKLKMLLNPSAYLPSEYPEQGKITMMSSLHSLEVLKNNLLTVESRVLGTIANQ